MDTIRRDALHAFIDEQLDRIAATPPPEDARALAAASGLTGDQTLALCAGAGIASQIGLALVADPGRFVAGWPEGGEPGGERPAPVAA